MANSGIYTITNIIDNKIYVGYASNISDRKRTHFKTLKKNIHRNPHLQNAYNFYGEENFVFETLEECEEEYLVALEHYWATILNVHNEQFGYNLRPTHPYEKTPRGYKFKFSQEVIQWRKNNYKLDENRIKKGKENIKKAQASNIGRKKSEQSKIKMSIAKTKIPRIIEIYDLKGKFLTAVQTQQQASRTTGVKRSAISMQLIGKSSKTKKYIFKYKILD